MSIHKIGKHNMPLNMGGFSENRKLLSGSFFIINYVKDQSAIANKKAAAKLHAAFLFRFYSTLFILDVAVFRTEYCLILYKSVRKRINQGFTQT